MERPALPALAGTDARWRAPFRLRQLRLGLGALSQDRAASIVVLACSGIAASAFASVALRRWSNYQTGGFDLGFFDQIIWNTAQGHVFRNSWVPYNFAGQHFEPILFVFAIPYRLGAGPLVLTLTQMVVVAAAAPVLYVAARRWGLSSWPAAGLAGAWLLNPYLHRALDFDFHPELMVALPLFAAAWALGGGRAWLAAAFALSALLFKEDAALVVAAFAALMLWRGERQAGIVTLAGATAWAAATVLVIMPLARQGQPSDLVDRYAYLVHARTQAELLPALLRQPWLPLRALAEPEHVRTGVLFVLASCPLAVLRPWTLPLLLPSLALALLSSHGDQSALQLQYSAEIVPLAALACLAGAVVAARRVPQPALAAALVLPAIVGFTLASPLAPWNRTDATFSAAHRQAVEEALALVPSDPKVVVSAQSGLVSELSQRTSIYEFPSHWDGRADWIIVDALGYRSGQSDADGYELKLAAVRQTYDRVFDRDGVEVFPEAVMDVVLIIPAKDEAETIGKVVGEVRKVFEGEIVVVDNNSGDGTAEIAAGAGGVLVRELNTGYGAACMCGVAAAPAGTAVFLFMDGDGSDHPADIPPLLSAIEAGADLALAVRRGPGVERGSIAPAARFGNWLSGSLIGLLWGRRLHDLSPLKAVRAEALRRIAPRELTYGWTVEVLATAAALRLQVVEVEAGYSHRAGGTSKVSGQMRPSLRAGMRIIATLARVWVRHPSPVRSGAFVGLLSALAVVGWFTAWLHTSAPSSFGVNAAAVIVAWPLLLVGVAAGALVGALARRLREGILVRRPPRSIASGGRG